MLKCTDAMDVQIALMYAESLLSSPGHSIKLLIFDNIASNFFEHRAAAIAMASKHGVRNSGSCSNAASAWTTSFGSKFAHKLDQLRRTHRILILTFTPTYFENISSSSTHLLGSTWDSLRKYRVKV